MSKYPIPRGYEGTLLALAALILMCLIIPMLILAPDITRMFLGCFLVIGVASALLHQAEGKH